MAQNLKAAAKKMKKKGRFGDSELVHVNPAEKKMLEDMSGGITSKNPDTGLDEHFWSILIPAGIGALTGAMNGGGLKGALKGALLGGATAGIGAGIGGLANGSGFMTGLGSMFGGEGAGLSGLGSLFGGGGAENGVGAAIGKGAGYSGAIGPLNPANSMGNIAMGARSLSTAAPVGAAEQSLFGGIGDFLKTPQGLMAASGALGLLTGDEKDPYAAEAARKKAEDKNYPIYNNGMRYAEGGAVFDQNNPTRINVGGLQSYAGLAGAPTLQPYTVDTAPTGAGAGIGAGDFGKEVYTPKTPSAAETAAAAATPSKPKTEYWLSPNGNIMSADGRTDYYNKKRLGLGMASMFSDSDWDSLGFTKFNYADGGSVKNREVPTDSDVTRPLRQSPSAQAQFAKAVQDIEKKIGRRLDNDEAQDLMGRMGGGIGQMQPTYAEGGPVAGIGSGKSDDIPAMLSDGEHVITADEVSMLGDGSNDAGHKKLYDMRKKLRKHKTGRTKQMPKAKAPESYAGIGA